MKLRSIFLIIFSILFLKSSIYPQEFQQISGAVKDKKTGKSLAGANILLEGTSLGAAADTNGEFIINNVPQGMYVISASVIGYKISKKSITILDAPISVSFSLEPLILPGQSVIVTAERAKERETPVAFTNMDREKIEQKYWSQEIPILLDEVPGVYSYSQTGSGLGYSEIKIRGFDATRVAVRINSVPLNDPEDHVTYFYDLPDISANVEDIQIQRGVGNSLYGTAAVGGSVSILTKNVSDRRNISLVTGWGSFNTRKYNFSYSSGIIDNRYSLYGRFSKIDSDGYRDYSWTKAWSYFLSASVFGKNSTTTFNAFGGPIKAHFAWYGIEKESLRDEKTRTINYDAPKYNGGHKDILDDFLQSHYQIINSRDINDKIKLQNTLFHVKGDGFYEQFKYNRKFQEYNLPALITSPDTIITPSDTIIVPGDTINRTDLVRRKWVSKSQFGWIPRLSLDHGNGYLDIGADISAYKSKHWGEVKWARTLPPGVIPNNRYYEYNTDKFSAAIYIHELFKINPDLNLMADFQYQHHTYDFKQEKIGAFSDKGYSYTLKYNFLTPRIGVNYNLSRKLNIFTNVSMARREPKDNDIYDADDPEVFPAFERKGSVINFDKPLIKPETLYDYEWGLGYQFKEMLKLKINGYWMDFRNEIVPTGQVDEDGFIIYGNAEKSLHRGVEISADGKIGGSIFYSTNLSISKNVFSKYTEYSYTETWEAVPVDRSGNKIAGFPDYMANWRISYRIPQLSLSFHVRTIGRQYLDNSEQKDLSIDPYTVANASIRFSSKKFMGLKNLIVDLKINNIFNKLYETHGAVYEGVPYYIPAATRNYFASLTINI